MEKSYISLGLMSGTSCDGIDASIIKTNGENIVEIIDKQYTSFSEDFRLNLKKLINECSSKKKIEQMNKKIKITERDFTLQNSVICNTLLEKNKNINVDLIGFHGQTILHKPNLGFSFQIGDSNLLSQILRKIVVSDFRKKDIRNGGQGAPLSPLYHNAIIKSLNIELPVALINIGGISNITYISSKDIVSFDVGPGNCLIDEWIYEHTGKKFDNDGIFASSGNVEKNILESLLNNPYFISIKAKSLDIKDFNLSSLRGLNLNDGAATLTTFTTKSIILALKKFKIYPNNIFLSGGGRKNKFILKLLQQNTNSNIRLIDALNFDGDFIEAQAFAYLAVRSYLKKNISFPSTTGVNFPCSGGKIYNPN